MLVIWLSLRVSLERRARVALVEDFIAAGLSCLAAGGTPTFYLRRAGESKEISTTSLSGVPRRVENRC
jgi:hypothetical protein